ncbi:MAG: hypothetical protein A3F72_19690 [Bacteroidetes bacterium RIFCSPLOWO2_12_FULL_35_15]|nr:MAG: hypothetical protein A3F72_19690 [Bacteroidetes bacterium RIFCSPLOWO2_12_FULL_35_15]
MTSLLFLLVGILIGFFRKEFQIERRRKNFEIEKKLMLEKSDYEFERSQRILAESTKEFLASRTKE